jgi:hypothetical protein
MPSIRSSPYLITDPFFSQLNVYEREKDTYMGGGGVGPPYNLSV